MILTDDTHEFACSDCTHTGKPCMEGLWLTRRLARSLAEQARRLDGAYDVTCAASFVGCGRLCHTLLRVRPARLEAFCGVADGAAAGGGTGIQRATVVASPLSSAARRPPLAAE
ncbi:MAG: hypothetical protein KJZ85_06255 [Rhodobacteraceae bacterium]|jgi:hypothetical protein|nr:hypothetical protein [Paracoccaceae bacterium]